MAIVVCNCEHTMQCKIAPYLNLSFGWDKQTGRTFDFYYFGFKGKKDRPLKKDSLEIVCQDGHQILDREFSLSPPILNVCSHLPADFLKSSIGTAVPRTVPLAGILTILKVSISQWSMGQSLLVIF